VARGGGAPLRDSVLAWGVCGFFGIQSMAFYASLSWIPSILEDGGWSSGAAGALLAFGALCGLVPAFLLPVLAARAPDQIRLLLAIVLVPCVGLLGVMTLPGVAPLWMMLIGFGQSGALGLGLSLPLQRGGDAPTVASLTAMMLCVGYLVRRPGRGCSARCTTRPATGPRPLVVLIAITLAELVPGLPASRARSIEEGTVDGDAGRDRGAGPAGLVLARSARAPGRLVGGSSKRGRASTSRSACGRACSSSGRSTASTRRRLGAAARGGAWSTTGSSCASAAGHRIDFNALTGGKSITSTGSRRWSRT
jgi:hypothetical protein